MKKSALVLMFLVVLLGCSKKEELQLSSAKELLTFSFKKADNTALTSDFNVTIIGNEVIVDLPKGTDVTQLIANFTISTNATLKIGSTTQVSSQTKNNFTSALIYTVIAEDKTTKNYTVKVNAPPFSSSKDLLTFSFKKADNSTLTSDFNANITGNEVIIDLPKGTDATQLIASFTVSPNATVIVGNTTQVSGQTKNNFTATVNYTIVAEDKSTRNYTVKVNAPPLPILTLSTSTLTFEGTEQSKQVMINSNVEWTVISTEPSWCNVSVKNGQSGITTLTISCTTNITTSPRNAKLTFSATDMTSQSISITQAGGVLRSFTMRAMNYTAWDKNTWSLDEYNDKAIDFLVKLGANTIVLDWMVQTADNGKLSADPYAYHPSWKSINSVINKAKNAGLKIILKPHTVDESGNGQNRYVGNTDPSKFLASNFFPDWKSYLAVMCSNLAINDVYAICIGTEMNVLDAGNRTEWIDLITRLRGIYKGQVTYDAMFAQYKSAKDIEDVVFWDQVDFIACSFYVRLSKNDNESVENLIKLMSDNPNVEYRDAIGYLESIHKKYNKPVFTLEGGYQSSNGALWDVNDYFGVKGTENQTIQANGFYAYLSALSLRQGNWLKGVSLWDLQHAHFQEYAKTDKNYLKGWGIVNKSATSVIQKYFKLQ